MPANKTDDPLGGEVLRLFHLVKKMREDLAAVYDASNKDHILYSAADQLNAIAAESEAATETILGASERITQIAERLLTEIKYGGAKPMFDQLHNDSRKIIEACQVHDVIGQRLAKVVRTINAVEGTLNSLVVTLGDGDVQLISTALFDPDTKDGQLTLTGPDTDGSGLKQTDIDGLFGDKKR